MQPFYTDAETPRGYPAGCEKIHIRMPFVAMDFGNTTPIVGWSDERIFTACEELLHTALRDLGELNPFEEWDIDLVRSYPHTTTLGGVLVVGHADFCQSPSRGNLILESRQACDDAIFFVNQALNGSFAKPGGWHFQTAAAYPTIELH